MLNALLSKLVASLLVACLCGAIITVVLSQTILSSHYLEGRIVKVNGYSRLSDALSNEAAQTNFAGNPQAVATLRVILTPSVLQQKINGALNQLQLYYEGKVPVPVINLSDLAAQAQAAGVSMEQDSELFKPIVLGNFSNTARVRRAAKTFDGVRTATIVASLMLVLVLLVLCWRRHRYTALPSVLISIGIFMGLTAFIFYLGAGLANRFIGFAGASNAFASLGSDLAESVAHDLARRFAIIAVVCLLVGIGTRMWITRLQTKAVPLELNTSKLPGGVISQ
jgi:hypothetical protein